MSRVERHSAEQQAATKKRKRKGRVTPFGRFLNFFGMLIMLAGILLALTLTVPRMMGIQTYIVVSGSMEPAISVGSMVYAKTTTPASLKEGDIIVFTPVDGESADDAEAATSEQGAVDEAAESADNAASAGSTETADNAVSAENTETADNAASTENTESADNAAAGKTASIIAALKDWFTAPADETVPITHRVVKNDKANMQLITKGDANADNDMRPVPYDNVLGIVLKTVKNLGYIASPMTTPMGKVALAMVIIAGWLLTEVGSRLRKKI